MQVDPFVYRPANEHSVRPREIEMDQEGVGTTLVQNKFLKCLRLVSRMGGSPTPVCGVATPCHPQAGGFVW